MHILTNDPLTELRELQRARRTGEITQAEFDILYRDLDRTSAGALCDNRDSRIAVQIRDGRRLCGVCLLILDGKDG